MLGFNANATVDDGSCIEPVPGCTHGDALNFNSLANVDDSSCRFDIPGCTDPSALNFFVLAHIDDGSCIYAGCTTSTAPNYNPSATLDDGSCQPRFEGCLNSTAVNYLAIANVHIESLCVFAGCTNSSARNYQNWVQIDDGSCEEYTVGCRDSVAANYASHAERDGLCLYYGCIHSWAINFDPTANVDDGSCSYRSDSGTLTSFGYLRGCRVFMDGYGPSFSDDGRRGREDPWATSSDIGHYTVVYRDPGLINVQSADAPSGFACTDSVTGAALDAPLRTKLNASIASPLTTVAVQLLGSSRLGAQLVRTPGFGSVGGTTGDFDEVTASDIVCRNLIPAIPCASSFQPCNTSTGYADACTLNSAAISVFHFDALRQYLLGFLPDPAWSAWIVAQINTVFSVGCAKNALMCASPQLCGNCESNCVAQGIAVGNFSKEAVASAVFFSLAEMAVEGPVPLEDQTGVTLTQLVAKSSARLGVASLNGGIASCAQTNFATYNSLVSTGASGRRHLEDDRRGQQVTQGRNAAVLVRKELVTASPSSSGGLGDHAEVVSEVCNALQPGGGSCQLRLSLALARLPGAVNHHRGSSPAAVSHAPDDEASDQLGDEANVIDLRATESLQRRISVHRSSGQVLGVATLVVLFLCAVMCASSHCCHVKKDKPLTTPVRARAGVLTGDRSSTGGSSIERDDSCPHSSDTAKSNDICLTPPYLRSEHHAKSARRLFVVDTPSANRQSPSTPSVSYPLPSERTLRGDSASPQPVCSAVSPESVRSNNQSDSWSDRSRNSSSSSMGQPEGVEETDALGEGVTWRSMSPLAMPSPVLPSQASSVGQLWPSTPVSSQTDRPRPMLFAAKLRGADYSSPSIVKPREVSPRNERRNRLTEIYGAGTSSSAPCCTPLSGPRLTPELLPAMETDPMQRSPPRRRPDSARR